MCVIRTLFRGIYYPKYYGRGGDGWLGKKNENEELGEKNKKKRERKREQKYMKKAVKRHLFALARAPSSGGVQS